jgi:hypothetical protein
MLVNILFGIIILLLIGISAYIYKKERYISMIHTTLGYYALRFGEFTPEQMIDWIMFHSKKDEKIIKK